MWLSGKQSTCQCRKYRRCRFNPRVGKIPGGGNGNPLQYSAGEKSWHGQRSLVGYRSTHSQESDTNDKPHTLRTHCKHRGLHSLLHDDLNVKEIQERGDVCILKADSLCCTVSKNYHNIVK